MGCGAVSPRHRCHRSGQPKQDTQAETAPGPQAQAQGPGPGRAVAEREGVRAGREDDAEGQVKPLDALEGEYWDLVRGLVGRTITIAYEADDGHPLYMRLATLTGEHNFFTRYEDAAVIARGIEARLNRLN